MSRAAKPVAGGVAVLTKATAKAASQTEKMGAVVDIVKVYHQACLTAFTNPDYCRSQAEKRNANNTVNAMVLACVSLHIDMMPTPLIEAPENWEWGKGK